MSSKKEKTDYAAPALERGLKILETLAAHAEPISQTDLARMLGKTAGEQFRLLSVLTRLGYIRRSEQGSYQLTIKLFHLGRSIHPISELVQMAREPMRDYSSQTGQECHLSLLEDGALSVLAQTSGTGPISLHVSEGSLHDPRSTASGRLLLSLLSSEALEIQLKRAQERFPETKATDRALRKSLRQIQKTNESISEDEIYPGIRDIALPLQIHAGEITLALASSRLAYKINPDIMRADEDKLRAVAASLTENLWV